MTIDLEPAGRMVADLLPGVTRLDTPTPCEHFTVGDLLGHIDGLTIAFALAAAKELPPAAAQEPPPGGASLPDGWQERIPRQLEALARAWRHPQAWEGGTKVGGVELTGEQAGMVALAEVVVHGWDLARATGQPYNPEPGLLETVHEHALAIAAAGPVEGLFGPAVEVAEDAPLLDRVIGLTGRDPNWQPN
ncbi:TIGR03086 family metal-binding protein [Saccharomonospora xinjiangensis]|uniref:TIGR03086 family protein n=1 Tax=Saccharomonospora xinjiangensis XJ-54 TaxID=882086 RepID=I0V2S0_9PSEU|nr:TIGR03086 family metal-binding protein [Saccharomonospora xinjiangensis]EID54423.1 TIGR03086 family protein [Saccharomonospora xinjiangensis XJ-54]